VVLPVHKAGHTTPTSPLGVVLLFSIFSAVVVIDVCKNEIGNFSTVIIERFEEE